MPRPIRASIDLEALRHNYLLARQRAGSARALAVVKANAYGHGIGRAIQALGGVADGFALLDLDEARALREAGITKPIVLLEGFFEPADLSDVQALGLTPAIHSEAQLVMLERAALAGPVDVLVKINTGMNRLGLSLAQLADPLVAGLEIDALLSHLASAEDDTPLNAAQLARWQEARRMAAHARASLANSAGIMLGEAYHGDLTRPGIALYGGVPCAALAPHIRQVVRPEAAIIQVRDLSAGDTVGYNATFTAPMAMRAAVISLGYADGYLRCWSGRGLFRSADGAALPVLGRVSMDMTIIDLAAAPHLREGDWVSADYSLPEAAATSGLSQYELLTLLGRRFQR